MDRPWSAATLRSLRLRAQHLTTAAAGDTPSAGVPATRQVAALVRHLTAVQAQEAPAAALALRVRAPDLSAAAVKAALTEQRSVVRTWCLRGTLQLVAAEDVGWLLSLVGAAAVRRSARRYTQLGLSEQLYREAAAVVSAAVEEQPRTRAQLAVALARRRVAVTGQAVYHLIRRCALEGLLCCGPPAGVEPTYVALSAWLGRNVGETGAGAPTAVDRPAALARLAGRYVDAHGPVTAADLSAWSGIGLPDARAGLRGCASELVSRGAQDAALWLRPWHLQWAARQVTPPAARLLPAFDPLLIGYRDRTLFVAAANLRHVHPGGGVLRPTVLIDGVAAGTWRLQRRAGKAAITIELFHRARTEPGTERAPVDLVVDAVLDPVAVEAEAAAVGAFLGAAAQVSWTAKPAAAPAQPGDRAGAGGSGG